MEDWEVFASKARVRLTGSSDNSGTDEPVSALSISESKDIKSVSDGLRHFSDKDLFSLQSATLSALQDSGSSAIVQAHLAGLIAMRREMRRRWSEKSVEAPPDDPKNPDSPAALKPILIVEDNRRDLELVLEAFGQVGLDNDIVVANDGEEALSHLFTHVPGRSLPAVILLDLKLPKVDGVQVLRRIKAEPATRRIPVVVLTSSRDERDVEACYEAGGSAYVVKQTSFEDFVASVRSLAAFWARDNLTPP
ncbi:response regulator [Azospirillum endophyticum]